MSIDVPAARAFMTTHARLLDRHRLEAALGGDGRGALAALAAYRSGDGGYGWALEPDLRAPGGQPVTALHAFEVFEVLPDPAAGALCDWLDTVTLKDGGLPFALPIDPAEAQGTAPFWTGADPAVSSLHMTTVVAGIAHRATRLDPAVRDHPWLARATEYCRLEIAGMDGPRNAMEFRYVLNFLDDASATVPWAAAEIDRLAPALPASGTLPVEGGAPGEAMRPLDYAPVPGRVRDHLDAAAVEAALDELAGGQEDDGGWRVDWTSRSPAGALEWRGHATVRAITLLRANGRL